jgi:hypothetical protein
MQTKGRVSHFVAGGSTGGTISGTGRFLKDMNPKIKVMLPDPVGSVFWDFWANHKAEKDLEAKSYQVRALPCFLMQNNLFCHWAFVELLNDKSLVCLTLLSCKMSQLSQVKHHGQVIAHNVACSPCLT